MKSYKGQAALEFMMTYGWAILVVLAAIGALSYFGILNPARFTPDTCLASSGFACPGKPIVNSTSLTFSIVNGLGYGVNISNQTGELTVVNIKCNFTNLCKQGDQCGPSDVTDLSRIVGDGEGATIHMTQCDFADVSVVKGELNFKYKNKMSGITEVLKVSVTGKPKD
jgi:hypothetical protein